MKSLIFASIIAVALGVFGLAHATKKTVGWPKTVIVTAQGPLLRNQQYPLIMSQSWAEQNLATMVAAVHPNIYPLNVQLLGAEGIFVMPQADARTTMHSLVDALVDN